jgi:hypothetical protein
MTLEASERHDDINEGKPVSLLLRARRSRRLPLNSIRSAGIAFAPEFGMLFRAAKTSVE